MRIAQADQQRAMRSVSGIFYLQLRMKGAVRITTAERKYTDISVMLSEHPRKAAKLGKGRYETLQYQDE